MNKDDRNFIKGLICDLRDELKAEIRHNGVLIERNEGNIRAVAENVSQLNRQMNEVQSDISHIKEEISILPVIKQVIKSHSAQLAQLCG